MTRLLPSDRQLKALDWWGPILMSILAAALVWEPVHKIAQFLIAP